MNKPTDFSYYLSKYFCRYLPDIKGASNNTMQTYTIAFKMFCQYLQETLSINREKITLEIISADIVTGFLDWLEDLQGCSVNTRNMRLNAIRSFFRYVASEEPKYMYHCQQVLAIPKKKAAKKVIEYLSIEGIHMLLDTPDKSTFTGRKHALLLTLIYATAARVSEIINLRVSDYRYNGNNLIRLTGKGNKSRLVPLEPKIMKIMNKYLEELKGQHLALGNTDYIFRNHSKQKLTRQGVTYILKKYVAIANSQDSGLVPLSISVHGLRHSRAVHWLQAGIDLIYIRDLLGHESVQTTEIYIRIDNELKNKALKKVSSDTYPDESEYIWQKNLELLEWLKSFS